MYTRARSVSLAEIVANGSWIEAAGVDEGASCDAATRIELIERLAFVGEPWCAEILRTALQQERTPSVRKAITSALKDS